MPRYNPFRPGDIVTPGMFSGRSEELDILEQVLFQTKSGNPSHFLIQGERGIGKSSLLFYIQKVAEGKIKSFESGLFKFLTVSIELEPSNSYLDIIKKIGSEFQRVVATHQPAKEMLKTAWDFLKKWEVAKIRYHEDNRLPEPHELLEELTHTIELTVSDMNPEFDGVIILIDEADRPPPKSNLGEFVKIFTERLTKRGCNQVALGVAGLSGILEKMKESHESSTRIFKILTLEPLLPEERVAVVRKGLKEALEKNGYEVKITPEAEAWIAAFSEGYPHFIQQFAYSAFDEDKDNLIDEEDVLRGAAGENGAFRQLGLKYYEELYFDQIGSDEYREVLRAMSEHLDGWVSKDEIRKSAKIREYTLDNAINALKKNRIIIAKEGRKGIYRLPTKSFAVWIKAFTQTSVVAKKTPPIAPAQESTKTDEGSISA